MSCHLGAPVTTYLTLTLMILSNTNSGAPAEYQTPKFYLETEHATMKYYSLLNLT